MYYNMKKENVCSNKDCTSACGKGAEGQEKAGAEWITE